MLEFDAKTTRLLEVAYQGADVTRRRQASFDALQPAPGETILDIGCGNGLLTLELARAVGTAGKVVGIDPSPDMRTAAIARCKEFETVDILDAQAIGIPMKNGSADKAASIQVFEYVEDLPAASKEVFRVLRKGGRLAIGDLHLDSLIWHSDDPDRMARMIAAWDHHFVERRIPAVLPSFLREAGFVVDEIRPVTVCDYVLKTDGLANLMMHVMEAYVVGQGHISENEGRLWREEQHALAKKGRFFFSITHFVLCARKP
ncbi:methyltransferase domain-containing protein [Falsihalocynthiibacter sp. BN13B15]|uniref:methyltransferase domain-containing protein n=1 Tax=Falsihalocynthiibacter sp. BN13B15 TaxID=3240871 RepID=UPI00350ED196